MIKIALFSDVHSNLPALKAVLEDIKELQADQVYCLGDLVDFAPWTNEVIELIRSEKITTIMGNHDERIAFDTPVFRLDKHTEEESIARLEAIGYTRKDIKKSNKQFLKFLPRKISLNFIFDEKPLNILLVHASSRTNEEYIYEDHDENDLFEMFNEHKADVIVTGHTHLSYVRQLARDKTIVNCGSVGRTKEAKQLAYYLMITIADRESNYALDFEIRKIAYDIRKTIKGIQQSTIPNFYADYLLKGLSV